MNKRGSRFWKRSAAQPKLRLLRAVLLVGCLGLAVLAGSQESGSDPVPSPGTPQTGSGCRVSGTIRFPKAGDIYLALVAEDEWDRESQARYRLILQPRSGQEIAFAFEGVAAGRYALKAFQDTNRNGKLDFLFGPTEPWGFYRSCRPAMRSPRFDEVAFDVRNDLAGITVELH